jgi:hypothetical protein
MPPRAPSKAAVPRAISKAAAETDEEEEGDSVTEVTAPDGSVHRVFYRGVEPGVEPGTPAFKKAKRLADNRASAAKSRLLARLKGEEMEVRGRE